jgi:hypothetical protein
MNHKILTNQIMLSLTEGYLSPCPSCFSLLALSALSLSHWAIKNLLARKKKEIVVFIHNGILLSHEEE